MSIPDTGKPGLPQALSPLTAWPSRVVGRESTHWSRPWASLMLRLAPPQERGRGGHRGFAGLETGPPDGKRASHRASPGLKALYAQDSLALGTLYSFSRSCLAAHHTCQERINVAQHADCHVFVLYFLPNFLSSGIRVAQGLLETGH